MKKIITLLVLVLIFALGMTACSEGSQTETQNSTAVTGGTVDVTTQTEAVQSVTNSVSENTIGTTGESTTEATIGATESAEKVLADNDDFSVTITSCVTDTEKGFAMYAEIENKTDNALLFEVIASALNNKDMHPEFSLEVPAKEKVNAPMIWSADKLEERRVTEVTEVKIELQVMQYGDNVVKVISDEVYVINP